MSRYAVGDFVEYDVGENLDPMQLFWQDSYGVPRNLTGWTGLVRIGERNQPALVEKTTGIVGQQGDDDTDPPTPSAIITFTTSELSSLAGTTNTMLIRFSHPALGTIDWKNGRFRIRVKPIILAHV